MRFLSFTARGVASYGARLTSDLCVDLPRLAASRGQSLPGTLNGLIRESEQVMPIVNRLLASAMDPTNREDAMRGGVILTFADIELDAPIQTPSKIVAVGLNYMDHCREQKVEPPKAPLLFAKFPSSIIGPGMSIRWDPKLTDQVDFEAELAVIIGKRATRVARESALDFVFGYTALNDVSARDLQFSDRQWVRAKSLDTFCPIGPLIVTKAEVPEPNGLRIACRVNGSTYQNSTTAEMIFTVPQLIEYVSQAITLEPGDIIATGTPDGVGMFRSPQVFLKDGDIVEVEIEKIGILQNMVATS
jgi:2-keto-4-pentenoate hydratase/2-oxohepta-3-ene-1,7-dioic acid hydratase in catechol pathway